MRWRELGAAVVGTLLLLLAGALGAPIEHTSRASERAPATVSREALRGPEDALPVASYTLTAKLDAASHTISGEGAISFVNHSRAALDEIFVHLYLNAFSHAETAFLRQRAGGFRGGGLPVQPGSIEVTRFRWREAGAELWAAGAHSPDDPLDQTDIAVKLPRPLLPGEVATFELTFTSRLPSVVLRSGHAQSFHMAAQWFPKLAKLEPEGVFAHFTYQRFSEFYADFGHYDVTLDVPESHLVGATGERVSEHVEGGRRVVRQVARGVHDFAFASWDGFDQASSEHEGVELTCLFPRGMDRAAQIQLDAARRGLTFFGQRFGRYPYRTLTLVHPPTSAAQAGGMEYPTLITTGGSRLSSHAPGRLLESLTLHELAHQWFYGMVASDEHAAPFLDEGLTSFATSLALREIYGDGGLVDGLPFALDAAALERARQLGRFSHEAVASGASDFESGSDYGALVYSRASVLLHTLERAWDGAASNALAGYAREFRFGHPKSDDLVRHVREQAGEDAALFLSRGLFERAFVDARPVSFQSFVLPEGDAFVGEAVVARDGSLPVPLTVELIDTEGRAQRVLLPASNRTEKIAYRGPSPLAYVVVDPDGLLLIDENKRNDALGNQAPGWAGRTFLLATLLGAQFMHVVAP